MLLLGNRDLCRQPVTELIPGKCLLVAQRDSHTEDAPLPGCLKDEFAVLAWDGEIVAHVDDAVVAHRSPPAVTAAAGSVAFATPIIASRVTSAANSSSDMPSVPAGRSGRTI